MRLKQFQVDAFAAQVFSGNPAAVCPLESWLDDGILQAIAEENNLSETAFFVPIEGAGFELRWFTPVTEVDLCGHATLAAAHVLFEEMGYQHEQITFKTRSGELLVKREGEQLRMDFPARPLRYCEAPIPLLEGLGITPHEVLVADDYIVVVDSEDMVRSVKPNFAVLSQLDFRGVIVTAPGRNVDFVSRFFAPKFGIPEDPVTGSAHCELTPYWAKRLGKSLLHAQQLSKRGGNLICELEGERVVLVGRASTFMTAELRL
jgi:predicted PhzF superfamily epimerase YddE/YHI9